MYCPFCMYEETKVIDSRLIEGGSKIKRRRQCLQCQERFTTFEMVELCFPILIKSSGIREEFCEQKIKKSIMLALQKRPISVEKIDNLILNIKNTLKKNKSKEIPTSDLGRLVMDELRKVDHIAYVRFSSVYCNFRDVEDFKLIIDKLSYE